MFMKSKHLFITLLCATLTMTACRSSYKISGIERTRILIDSRYDKPLSKELDEYMEPFTHAVDSIKSPVVGKAAQYMSAKRPEGLLSNLLPDILMWASQFYNEQEYLDYAAEMKSNSSLYSDLSISSGDTAERRWTKL